ncbi:MAG: box helicase domain protein [Myxococcaceae bacterium]|nr:box helicase domain protein [Myxococcaceae bacterium]
MQDGHGRGLTLVEGVVDRSGTYQYVDVDGSHRIALLLNPRDVIQRRSRSQAQDVLVPLLQKLMRNADETILVFRNTRGSAAGTATYLSRELELPAAAAGSQLSGVPASLASTRLKACLDGGVAFHNSNLSKEERVIVERAFRDPASGVRVIASTATLAAGINTPASTVMIVETQTASANPRPFSIAEYKNMVGRAGRPGYRSVGRSVLYAETPLERDRLFRRYVLGVPEQARSSFDDKKLDTWVLRLLAQTKAIGRKEVPGLLASTYGGYLAVATDPRWQTLATREIETLVSEMVRLELLDDIGGTLHLTRLGLACGRSPLSFQSCLILVDLLRAHGAGFTARELMLLAQALPEADQTYIPVARRNGKERLHPEALRRRVSTRIVALLQKRIQDDLTYFARCKRGLVLLDWIDGVAALEIEQHFRLPFAEVGLGDMTRIAEQARFQLGSVGDIARCVFEHALPEEALEGLARELEFGVPDDMRDLTALRADWRREELVSLRTAGVKTRNAIAALSQAELGKLVGGLERAARIASARTAGTSAGDQPVKQQALKPKPFHPDEA